MLLTSVREKVGGSNKVSHALSTEEPQNSQEAFMKKYNRLIGNCQLKVGGVLLNPIVGECYQERPGSIRPEEISPV